MQCNSAAERVSVRYCRHREFRTVPKEGACTKAGYASLALQDKRFKGDIGSYLSLYVKRKRTWSKAQKSWPKDSLSLSEGLVPACSSFGGGRGGMPSVSLLALVGITHVPSSILSNCSTVFCCCNSQTKVATNESDDSNGGKNIPYSILE